MKICIICQNLQTLGGLQVVVMTIVQWLQKRNVNITILMPTVVEKNTLGLSEKLGVNILALDTFVPIENMMYKRIIRSVNRNTGCLDFKWAVPVMKYMLFSSKSINRLAQFINEQNFDWVIGTAFNYSLLAAILADKVNCKTAGWMHSTFRGYYEVKGVAYYGLKCLNKKYLPRLDLCFVLNKSDKKFFDNNYGLNTIVLHNPIPGSIEKKNLHKKGELLFVGRINRKVKGLDYLVEILKQLNTKQINFHMTIVGDGKDIDWLKQMIYVNELETRVTFAGFQEDVIPYYERAYILLSTSCWEGFGMSIVEAMSVGTPCISFKNDGVNEIINKGIEGILVEKYQIGKFVDEIQRLIEDDKTWENLSRAAFERAKDFRVDKIASQLYANLAIF